MKKKEMREHMFERFGFTSSFTENPPLPNALNIELNSTCNHSCIFCMYHGEMACQKLKPTAMKLDFAKKILDEAWRLGIGKKEVGFYMAGEPFLYKELPTVIKYAKELGFTYTYITSNGALATKEKVDSVIDAGLDSIRFSVNAGDRNTYKEMHGKDDFDVVVKNIKYLDSVRKNKEKNISVSLSCVVTRKTQYVVDDIKRVFSEYVDDFLFIPVRFDGLKSDEKFRQEYQMFEYSKNTKQGGICPIVFNSMYINAFGWVVSCCYEYNRNGNIGFFDLNKELDLEKAWNCEGFKKYREGFLKGKPYDDTYCNLCVLNDSINRISSFNG